VLLAQFFTVNRRLQEIGQKNRTWRGWGNFGMPQPSTSGDDALWTCEKSEPTVGSL